MSEFIRVKFDVLWTTRDSVLNYKNSATVHEGTRANRYKQALEFGDFKVVNSYVVDTGHPEGLELHSVTSTGVVIIVNIEKEQIITYLIARPEQLKRYGIVDLALLDLARQHEKAGYNLI